MRAYCLGDGGDCNVEYASYRNELKYGAVYQEELPSGIVMLLIPSKTNQIEAYQKYRHFNVEGDERLFECMFTNQR